MRRILIIAAVAVVIVGIALAAYFYFTRSNGLTTSSIQNTATNFPSSGNATTQVPTSVTGGVPGSIAAPSGTAAEARLVEISVGPVVPATIAVDTATSTATASTSDDVDVGFIERQSGNIYSYLVRANVLTRTSDRTLPGIEDAWWLPNGLTAFVQYLSGNNLSTVNTYALPANGSQGFFMPQDLAGFAVSSANLLSLASGVNGSVASLSHIDGTDAKQLFTTPLSELRVSFAGKNQYLAFTNPSASLPGYAFLVNGAGAFTRIAGPLPGLVALASPSGAWVLISYDNATTGGMEMALVNTATEQALPLPVATIADKCVWTADSSAIYCGIPQNPPTGYAYPDDWYQGAVSFSDQIWKINVAERYAQMVLDITQASKEPFDAEGLSVDASDSVLVMVNKADGGSVWSYQL